MYQQETTTTKSQNLERDGVRMMSFIEYDDVIERKKLTQSQYKSAISKYSRRIEQTDDVREKIDALAEMNQLLFYLLLDKRLV